MSDSEDDFMSDKFLVEVPSTSASKGYTERRSAQSLKNMRRGQAGNKVPLKQLEEERRREGLNTSLFDLPASSSSAGIGGASGSASTTAKGRAVAQAGTSKAMDLMMKMGWKVGEGLGKKRSPSPPSTSASSDSKRAKITSDEEAEETSLSRGGLGSSARSTSTQQRGRVEPLRVSLWAGRKGLAARSPSPPPLPRGPRDPDALDPTKLERLGRETEGFRERQRREYGIKEMDRKGRAGRERLREFDRDNGVKFHPLHVLPSDPLGSVPRPLLRLIYPSQPWSPSPSPEPAPIQGYEEDANASAAEKMRAQMRRDMLSAVPGDGEESDEEGVIRFGVDEIGDGEGKDRTSVQRNEARTVGTRQAGEYDGVNWEEMVSGTKRVLAMDPETYLNYVVDQLRHEHLFCFWCAYRYKSVEEMDGPGGCPGEEEDDH